jgi:hypothetical protein
MLFKLQTMAGAPSIYTEVKDWFGLLGLWVPDFQLFPTSRCPLNAFILIFKLSCFWLGSGVVGSTY